MDAGSADPPQHRRRRYGVLLHLCPAGTSNRNPGQGSKDIAGRSKIALRRLRTNSGSTTMKRAPARLASSRLARHARLRHDGRDPASRQRHAAPKNEPPKDDVQRPQNLIAIDPLVGPRNPSHRHPSCTTTDQPPARHCVVSLETAPIKLSLAKLTSNGFATVVLGRVDGFSQAYRDGIPESVNL